MSSKAVKSEMYAAFFIIGLALLPIIVILFRVDWNEISAATLDVLIEPLSFVVVALIVFYIGIKKLRKIR